MTTPATRKVSSDMHWAAWLSLILAVLGLWLLVEIITFKTDPPMGEMRYPVAQHDFSSKSADSTKSLAENEPIHQNSTATENDPLADHSALSGGKETPKITDEMSTSDPEMQPHSLLANAEKAEAETTVALIEPAPSIDENLTDSSDTPATFTNQDTVMETPTDPATRYVTVWTGNIRREPNNQSAALFQLRWGQKVAILGDQGRWYQIKTADGQRGWGHKTLFDTAPPSYDAISGLKGVVDTIRVQMDGARACTVFIDLDSDQPPDTQVLEGEVPRLVSDFPRLIANPKIANTIPVHNGVINAIRVGITTHNNLTTRVVVDLIPGIDYVVDQVFYQEEQTYALHIKAKEV